MISKNDLNETLIGNPDSYNLKVIVDIDKSKKTNAMSFSHVKKETLLFRFKARVLKTTVIPIQKLDGYALVGVWVMKSDHNEIYLTEYYRSNGSPKIFIYYDRNGTRICKLNCSRKETKYLFIRKGYSKDFFDNLEEGKHHDIELF